MLVRVALAVGGVLALAACETVPAGAPATSSAAPAAAAAPAASATVQFRTADFEWSRAPGQGRVDGRVTYRANGAAHVCADSGVVLAPETPWFRRRMEILYLSSDYAALPPLDVRQRTPPESAGDYTAFARRATCDADGRFTFSGLPDGAWYVIAVTKPKAPATGPEVAIMRRVTVSGGRTITTTL